MEIPDSLVPIHETSLNILSEIGMRFRHEKALEVFHGHGFTVDKDIVRFDPQGLLSAVALSPSQFKLYARNSEHDAIIGGDHIEFAPCYGAPFIIDPNGCSREGSVTDFVNLVRLTHQCSLFKINGGVLVQPAKLDPLTALPVLTLLSIFNSDKCLFSANGNDFSTRLHFSMLELLFGGRDSLSAKPRTFTIINTLSPLQVDRQALDTLFEYVDRKQAIAVSPTVMAGTTGPVTLAGTLALLNAEALAVIALAQLANPGTPVIYGCQATGADMRTGGISIGGPERPICIKTGAALARGYGLPYRSGGCDTDSHSVDAQCGSESMMALLTTCGAHTNLIIHSTGILAGYSAVSLEKFVYDIETIHRVMHFLKYTKTDEAHLAFDEIARVGIGGEYLTSPHTLKHCRKSTWTPRLSLRSQIGITTDNSLLHGKIDKDMKRRLAEYCEPELSSNLKKEMVAMLEGNGVALNPNWIEKPSE